MTVQILDKFGHAIRRRHFYNLRKARAWVESMEDEISRCGYQIEIFCDWTPAPRKRGIFFLETENWKWSASVFRALAWKTDELSTTIAREILLPFTPQKRPFTPAQKAVCHSGLTVSHPSGNILSVRRGKAPPRTRKEWCSMATTITRATALSNAIALFPENAPEREVLGKMLASITKPRPKTASKASRENAALASEVLKGMPEGVALTVKEVASLASFPVSASGSVSPQKVAAVMKMLIDAGQVARAKVGKVTVYTRV